MLWETLIYASSLVYGSIDSGSASVFFSVITMWTSVWVFLNLFTTNVDTHTHTFSFLHFQKDTLLQKAIFTEVQTYITIQSRSKKLAKPLMGSTIVLIFRNFKPFYFTQMKMHKDSLFQSFFKVYLYSASHNILFQSSFTENVCFKFTVRTTLSQFVHILQGG